jgi:hypothetical protein
MILPLIAGGLGGLASLPIYIEEETLKIYTCPFQFDRGNPHLLVPRSTHPLISFCEDLPIERQNRLPESLLKFLISLIEEENPMTLLAVHDLATDTIKSYRSKLRRLWLNLPTLSEGDAYIAQQKIARLEQQLGIKASDVQGPGRPRRFV